MFVLMHRYIYVCSRSLKSVYLEIPPLLVFHHFHHQRSFLSVLNLPATLGDDHFRANLMELLP